LDPHAVACFIGYFIGSAIQNQLIVDVGLSTFNQLAASYKGTKKWQVFTEC